MKIREIISEVGYSANAAGGLLPTNTGGAAQTPSKEHPTGPYGPADNANLPVNYKKTKGLNNSVLPKKSSSAEKDVHELINGFVTQPGGFSPINGINNAGKQMYKNKKEINQVDTEKRNNKSDVSKDQFNAMKKSLKR